MSNSIPKITVPRGGFHLRRIDGRPANPERDWSFKRRAAQSAFRQKLSEYVRFRPSYLFYPSDYPTVSKGLEVARSDENYFSRYLRALDIMDTYGSSSLEETTVSAMLFLELDPKQFKFYSEYYEGPWGRVRAKRAILRKALRLPFSGMQLVSRSAAINYQALLRRVLINADDRDLFLAYLALELARLEEHPHSIMSDAYRKQILMGLAPMAERYGFLDLSEIFRSEALLRIVGEGTVRKIEGMRTGKFRNVMNVRNHLDNLKEILAESLLPPFIRGPIQIEARVKGIYSIWEKKENWHYRPVDIRGAEIRVKDLETLWKVVKFLKKNFRKPTPQKFPELCQLRRERKIKFETDNITAPRSSGYSAYTLLLVDYAGEVVEFKVTTFDRHKVNVEGKAAHWAYKAERSLKIFGMIFDQDLKAPEPKEDEALVLISRSADPSLTDPANGYVIKRFEKGTTVKAMEKELGGRAVLYQPQGDELLTKDEPDEIDLRPARIPKNALLEDGMLFGLQATPEYR